MPRYTLQCDICEREKDILVASKSEAEDEAAVTACPNGDCPGEMQLTDY